jgi:hypothetical protein
MASMPEHQEAARQSAKTTKCFATLTLYRNRKYKRHETPSCEHMHEPARSGPRVVHKSMVEYSLE